MTIKIVASKSPWLFSLMFILTQNLFFHFSDRVVGGGLWTTEPPFPLETEDPGGVPEWVVSFFTSFGSYLLYTGVWCGFKAGLDAGELAFWLPVFLLFVVLIPFSYFILYRLLLFFYCRLCFPWSILFLFFSAYRRLHARFPDHLEEGRYALKWSR